MYFNAIYESHKFIAVRRDEGIIEVRGEGYEEIKSVSKRFY
jgi:hypothetical protein